MQLLELASKTKLPDEGTVKFLLDSDPLFSLTVKLWQENKLLTERVNQLEEAESLRRIQECVTT
jgi:hypothetical protein